jgi:spoIIIJ-associated protein
LERDRVQTECVKEAGSIAEAVDAALEELGVQQDAVEYEVLEEPTHRRFGLGTDRGAKVRVWVKPSYIADLEVGEVALEEEEEPLPEELLVVASTELTDEDLDRVADAAVAAIQKILESFGVEGATIEEYEGDEGEIILDVVGGDLALLIGRHGRTLDALQAIVSAITSRGLGFRHPIIVDVEGYRHRRRQKIEDIARRAADRATRQHGAVRLRPMTAYERRVVHVALRDDQRVSTGSEGEDPFRLVVVSPR